MPPTKADDGNDSKSTIRFGSSVKTLKELGPDWVGGYLVVFGDKDNTDLERDFFTKATDFDLERSTKCTPYFSHGMDKTIGTKKFGQAAFELKVDDVGVWVQGQLNMRDAYEKAVYAMAEDGKLGWSSGTAPHLVERKSVGDAFEILTWPLGLDASMTPTPAEPRTAVVAMKSLKLPGFEKMLAMKSVGMSQDDRSAILNNALNALVAPSFDCWVWVWIVDIFDDTIVYVVDDCDDYFQYFEAKYKFNGNVPEIGEGVPVVRTTKYEPVTSEDNAEVSGMKSAKIATKSKDNTVGALLQAKIHQAFTEAADELAIRGYVNTEQRIAMSKAIGDLLRAFRDAIDPEVAAVLIDDIDVDWIAAKSLKSISAAIEGLNSLRFSPHSQSVLTAVKGFTKRARDYADLREDHGRQLSPERSQEFKAILEELSSASSVISAIVGEHKAEPAPVVKAADKKTLESLRADLAELDDVSGWLA